MPNWQLQEAKARFSELMRGCSRDRSADDHRPRTTSGRRSFAMITTASKLEALIGRISADFTAGGVRLNIVRDQSPPRDIEL